MVRPTEEERNFYDSEGILVIFDVLTRKTFISFKERVGSLGKLLGKMVFLFSNSLIREHVRHPPATNFGHPKN